MLRTQFFNSVQNICETQLSISRQSSFSANIGNLKAPLIESMEIRSIHSVRGVCVCVSIFLMVFNKSARISEHT